MYYTKKDKKQSDNEFDEEDNSESRTKTIIRVIVYLSFIILGILFSMFAFQDQNCRENDWLYIDYYIY